MQASPGIHPYGGVVIPVHGATVSYEFNQAENQRIEKVGGRAKICGVISLVTGVFGALAALGIIVALVVADLNGQQVVAALLGMTAVLPPSIVNLVIGVSYMRAGKALTDVTTTQGHDVKHMMASLERFKSAFRLETILAAVTLTLGLAVNIIVRSLQ